MASKTIFSALSNDKRKSYEALKNCLLLVMQKIAGIRIGLLPQLQQSAGIWDAASWKTKFKINCFQFTSWTICAAACIFIQCAIVTKVI